MMPPTIRRLLAAASLRAIPRPARVVLRALWPGRAGAPAMAGPVDAQAAYRAWIDTVEGRMPFDVVQTPPAPVAAGPRYSLLLPNASDAGAVTRTLLSLARQGASRWELLLSAALPPAVRGAVSDLAADVAGHIVFVDAAGDRGAVLDRLLAAARGDWIAALSEGDALAPGALDAFDLAIVRHPGARILYSDEDAFDAAGQRVNPLFKPEHAPEQLQAFNYFGRLCCIDRRLALAAGGFGAGRGAGAEWSLNLRAADAATRVGGEVRRIPRVLCHRGAGSVRDRVSADGIASRECEAALADHWRGRGIGDPRVTAQPDGTFRSTWTVDPAPLVSVVIPHDGRPELLRACVEGVLDGTAYPSFELIVVASGAEEPKVSATASDPLVRPGVTIVRIDDPFGRATARNRGAGAARGRLLLFLDAEAQVVDPNWMGELVRVAGLPGVGAVGPRLVEPDGTLRRAGTVTGAVLSAPLFGPGADARFGVFGSPDHTRNAVALAGPGLMVRREAFEAVGGFDESDGPSFGEVSLGLKMWAAGWRNADTPFAMLACRDGEPRDKSAGPHDAARLAAALDRLGVADDPFFHPRLDLGEAGPRLRRHGDPSPRDILDELRRRPAGESPQPEAPLDLWDVSAVEAATRLSRDALLWPPQRGGDIVDRTGAARFLMDLLRSRPDLRLRFPDALTGGALGAFADWLAGEGRGPLGLTEAALAHVRGALGEDLSRPLRQYLMFRDDVRIHYPLGFTPAGRRGLIHWVATEALHGGSDGAKAFGAEAMWWLFLTCAEDPAGELAKTYLFMPEWQRLHPDGLTIFGRDRFAAWLVARYGLSTDHRWLAPAAWPALCSPAEDLRLAYDARQDWRTAHPNAFATRASADALLAWLAGPDGLLPEGQRAWCAARLDDGTADELARPGVNVLGHFCFPSGLRVSVRSMADAMETAGLLVSRRDIRTYEVDDPEHVDFVERETHDVTVIHAQSDPFFADAYARADIAERRRRTHRVAYWYWELDTAPAEWAKSARQVDELWTATRFVADALRGMTDKPVHTLFPGVRLPGFTTRSRAHFGLPAREEGRFAFLFSFHMDSVMERKNPLGLIESFRLAFRPDEPVDLVLKTTSFGNYDSQLAKLAQAAGDANVHVLDRVLDGSDIVALMDSCDAYVSLHRSEGLGLTMAEAMLLGKPVVATRYSGNLDFMDDENSLLVDCDIVPIRGTVPPYTVPGARWAEPSTAHAAALMRRVYDDAAFRDALGRRAKLSAERNLSIEAAGRRFAERVDAIRRSRGASRPGRN